MARRWSAVTVTVAAALALAGCGPEQQPFEVVPVSTQPLAGKIGGQPWTYTHAQTNAARSTGTDYHAELFSDGIPGCGFATTANRAVVTIPREPGDYPFSPERAGEFVTGAGTRQAAGHGRIIVEAVSGGVVRARVHMIGDASNEIDGAFVTTICP